MRDAEWCAWVQLRYQPTDDITPIIKARRESSEAAYIALMRDFFLPQPTNA